MTKDRFVSQLCQTLFYNSFLIASTPILNDLLVLSLKKIEGFIFAVTFIIETSNPLMSFTPLEVPTGASRRASISALDSSVRGIRMVSLSSETVRTSWLSISSTLTGITSTGLVSSVFNSICLCAISGREHARMMRVRSIFFIGRFVGVYFFKVALYKVACLTGKRSGVRHHAFRLFGGGMSK